MKPAWEPIVLARKPLDGTVAANVLQHGTGALNIDGCRIEAESRPLIERRKDASLGQTRNTYGAGINGSRRAGETTLGRWPANVVHDGSEEVLAHFPNTKSGELLPHHKARGKSQIGTFNIRDRTGEAHPTYGDTGSAARFFFSAKADADDRIGSKHPTVKPVQLMRWLVRLVTPKGGLVLDPFAGTGTTGVACIREGMKAILIEREDEYVADIKRRFDMLAGLDTPLFAESKQEGALL